MKFLVSLGLCAVSVCAQSFNIDLNATAGIGSGVPASTFGAAASQPGTWNGVAAGAATTPIALNDLANVATPATIQRSGAAALYQFNNTNTTGDTELLMDDLDDPSPGPLTYTFAGLTPGKYRVYTYAWAPDSATFFTNVTVTGSPVQTVGGAMAALNTFTQGITHAVHDVVTSTGTFGVTVQTAPAGGFSSINGFQIVRCPNGFSTQIRQTGSGAALDIAFTCGNAGDFYALAVTPVQGAFPNGAFFGIELDQPLLDFALQYGPPLFGTLDANGNAFGSFPGPIPSGLTIYAVGVTANPTLTVISSSTPFSYTTL
jgi:hypothetical protein